MQAPHKVGDVIEGRYEIDEIYGTSGACWYYKARYLPAPVVFYTLKELDPSLVADERALRAFEQELVTSEHAECPPFIRNQTLLHAVHGRRYLVREQIVTGSLGKAMAGRAGLSVIEATRVISGIGLGCIAAHATGRALGCVSPSDVLMPIEGRLTANNVRLLQPGYAVGEYALEVVHRTPYRDPFVAPEVALSGEPTIAGDIFGLGVMLAYLLTGETFDEVECARRTLIERGDSNQVVAVVDRACRPRPADRFASVDDLLVALRHCASNSLRRGEPASGRNQHDFIPEDPSSYSTPPANEQVVYASRDDEHELTPPDGSAAAASADASPSSGGCAANEGERSEGQAEPAPNDSEHRRGQVGWSEERTRPGRPVAESSTHATGSLFLASQPDDADSAGSQRRSRVGMTMRCLRLRACAPIGTVSRSIARHPSAFLVSVLVVALAALFVVSQLNSGQQSDYHELEDRSGSASALQSGTH